MHQVLTSFIDQPSVSTADWVSNVLGDFQAAIDALTDVLSTHEDVGQVVHSAKESAARHAEDLRGLRSQYVQAKLIALREDDARRCQASH